MSLYTHDKLYYQAANREFPRVTEERRENLADYSERMLKRLASTAEGRAWLRSYAQEPGSVTPPLPPAPLFKLDPANLLSRFKIGLVSPGKYGLVAPSGNPEPVVDGGTINVYVPSRGERCELEPDFRDVVPGDDLFFGWHGALAEDFPTRVPGWQVVMQWKNRQAGSPPLEVKVKDGQFWLDGGWGHPDGPKWSERSLGPCMPGVKQSIVVRALFHPDPVVGSVDVWLDGAQVVKGWHPPGGTLYPAGVGPDGKTYNSSRLRVGLYRDTAITQPGIYHLSDVRIGESYASVA